MKNQFVILEEWRNEVATGEQLMTLSDDAQLALALQWDDEREMAELAATEYPEGTTDWNARRKAFLEGMRAQQKRAAK